ncbi:Sodium-dependent phosphate transport protein 1 [Hibiscus syriacus]|uniref:Sodium-dependent phosphate transport protein 1 n=1 Tax=Hibiscus syriacus TaxID=106335 RepID=A0A6A2ZM06_HIBSY|nr:Sodium-dependent phosphate transport protein 1 [Hibiscus syriacus]
MEIEGFRRKWGRISSEMGTDVAVEMLLSSPLNFPKSLPHTISTRNKINRTRFLFRVPSNSPHVCRLFRVSVSEGRRRRRSGKVYADVRDILDFVRDSVKFKDALNDVASGEDDLDSSTVPWWEQFPKRWVIVVLCFSAFLLCIMDRVNMSIAILPMSAEFHWNPATVGLIQSSFSCGYLLTQIAGGIWADTLNWSCHFCLSFALSWELERVLLLPAMNSILSKWVPVAERSRSLALVYSGMYLGSVTGLAFSPFLIHEYGWPSVFYSFGSLGTVWVALWINKVLKFNLTESGLLCVLPWLTMAFSANLGGWIADTLVSRGLSVTTVRKIMQSIGFLGPAFFFTQLSHVKSPAMAVLCMSCSQGTDAFSQSGLYSNHRDIAPRYSGVLLGLSNTAGVLAWVFGTAATGYILQHGSWDDVFKVSIALYLVGTVVWNLFSTGEKILD